MDSLGTKENQILSAAQVLRLVVSHVNKAEVLHLPGHQVSL